MKTIYIKDLQKDQVFQGEPFAVSQSSLLTGKNGKPYMNITLSDKTGTIQSKIWSNNLETLNRKLLQPGKLVAVDGKVGEYRGVLQLEILAVDSVDESALDDFIATSEYYVEEMTKALEAHINSIENKDLQAVVQKVLSDDELARRFKFWPAGNSIHHGFRSGLLQHVLEMFDIATSLKHFYPDLNYDVLIAGIVFHDIGKIHELSGGLTSNYTRIGGLQGHISIGAQMFLDLGGSELPDEVKEHVVHLILAHHGKLEYGSPVVPATPEAIALHYIDNLSSKLRGSLSIIEQIPEDNEFSPPSYFFEGARFWKNHNTVQELNDSDSNELSEPENNDDDSTDQLKLT